MNTIVVRNHKLIPVAGVAFLFAVVLVYAAASFIPANQPTGWITPPTASSADVSNGSEVMFRTDYSIADYAGSILANDIDANGNIQASSPWSSGDAADELDAQNFDTGRKIITLKEDGSKIPFRWASLSTAQQNSIGDSTVGPKLLNFVRGDRSNETPNGENFRQRTHVLGDIQHSSLIYFDHGAGVERLYVGANDGMLHVIDATDGTEVFAYVPSMLMPTLKLLSADPYVHTPFVDGRLIISRVDWNGDGATIKTILVGSLGAGGKGLFALDITDPSPGDETNAAAKILWEITPASINNTASTDYEDLGYTYGTPRIARLDDAGKTLVAIVGNGYVNSGNGHAVLYVINLKTGQRIARIDTGSGSTASPNGLSSATVIDINKNRRIDFAYAGDLDGNLWKFDLLANTATKLFTTHIDQSDTTSATQAITVAPVVFPHPHGGYMVDFATGRMLEGTDSSDTSVHYAYGIWDGAPADNDTLLTQTLTETTYDDGTNPPVVVRSITDNIPDWTSGTGHHKGWKVALAAGERVTGEIPFRHNQRFYFSSTNPTIVNQQLPNGRNWLNEFNELTGGSSSDPIFDLSGDTLHTDADRIQKKQGDGTNVTPIVAETGAAGIAVSLNITDGIMSQPLLLELATSFKSYFNTHPDVIINIPNPDDRGVSGGHFDVDIYYKGCTVDKKGKLKCSDLIKSQKHFHQYDDIFDVTGVNFLNASSTTLNLPNAITDNTTRFKLLLINQSLNRAMSFSIGGNPHTNVKNYLTGGNFSVSNLTSYSLADIGTFEVNLPLDAFSKKDWWGDGDIRVGAHPTQTGCVNKMNKKSPDIDPTPGPNGEWKNGALVFQLIKENTPDSVIQLNVAGDTTKGYRVKNSDFEDYVLAEYSIFWHHPNKACYGDASWVKDPDQDTDPTDPDKVKDPAPGSDDPKFGSFRSTSAATGTTTTTSGDGTTTTTTTTYADGTTYVRKVITNNDGSLTIIETFPDSTTKTTVSPGDKGSLKEGLEEKKNQGATGRLSWRELFQ